MEITALKQLCSSLSQSAKNQPSRTSASPQAVEADRTQSTHRTMVLPTGAWETAGQATAALLIFLTLSNA